MAKSRRRVTQDGIGGIERGGLRAAPADDVGMLLRGCAVKGVLERGLVEPRAAGLAKKSEMIGHGAELFGVRAVAGAHGQGYSSGEAAEWPVLSA